MNRPLPPTRRGISTITTVVLLVTMQLVIVGLVLAGARDDDLTVRRLNSVQAFYAAEAGMNMAVREMIVNSDEDTDGGVGTIASIAIGPVALVEVTTTVAAGQTTLTSAGSAGAARREIEAATE